MFFNTIWEQQYNPLGNIWLSALVAVVPIIVFLISLVVLKLKGYIAGLLSIITSSILAILVYGMPFDKIFGSRGARNSFRFVASSKHRYSSDFLIQTNCKNRLF